MKTKISLPEGGTVIQATNKTSQSYNSDKGRVQISSQAQSISGVLLNHSFTCIHHNIPAIKTHIDGFLYVADSSAGMFEVCRGKVIFWGNATVLTLICFFSLKKTCISIVQTILTFSLFGHGFCQVKLNLICQECVFARLSSELRITEKIRSVWQRNAHSLFFEQKRKSWTGSWINCKTMKYLSLFF